MNTEKPEVTTEKHITFFSDFLRKSFTENKKNENNTEKIELNTEKKEPNTEKKLFKYFK